MTTRPTPVLWLLMALTLSLPAPAAALPTNRSVALEAALERGGAAAATLSAGAWLEWELEGVARLSLGSAPRTGGRGTARAVTPEVGLRWTRDVGWWRPVLALSAGARLPSGGRTAAATALLLGGVERRLGGGWGLTAGAGLRLRATERAAWEAALGVRLGF